MLFRSKQGTQEKGSDAASPQTVTSLNNEQLAQILDMLKSMQVQASTSFVQKEPCISEDDWQC